MPNKFSKEVNREEDKEYSGYEIGPIRPPSESTSLLLRTTRKLSLESVSFLFSLQK